MALYSVLLEPDNKGLLKLLNYVSSESIINNKIRPSINIGAFICERESVILDFYSGLAHILEPFFLNFINIGVFDNGTVYLEPMMDDKLKSNFYKTYATMSKHFDAGFGGKFLPSVWKPYITVGFEPCYEDALELRDCLKSFFEPFSCCFKSSALIRCEPYRVIARYDMPMYNTM